MNAAELRQRNHELREAASVATIVIREIVRLIESGQADTARLTALEYLRATGAMPS